MFVGSDFCFSVFHFVIREASSISLSCCSSSSVTQDGTPIMIYAFRVWLPSGRKEHSFPLMAFSSARSILYLSSLAITMAFPVPLIPLSRWWPFVRLEVFFICRPWQSIWHFRCHWSSLSVVPTGISSARTSTSVRKPSKMMPDFRHVAPPSISSLFPSSSTPVCSSGLQSNPRSFGLGLYVPW